VISRDVIVGDGARGSNKSSWPAGWTMRKKELILTAFGRLLREGREGKGESDTKREGGEEISSSRFQGGGGGDRRTKVTASGRSACILINSTH